MKQFYFNIWKEFVMKKHLFSAIIVFMLLVGGSVICAEPNQVAKIEPNTVTKPPESIVAKYNLNPFYKKYLDVNGIAVTSSDKVADEALLEVRYLISNMLAHRQDIWKRMADSNEGTRIVVIGSKEQVSEVPEYYIADANRAAYQNRRVRGYGSPELTSCGEENLLNYRGDRYNGENIFIHEFGHCIDNHLRRMDPNFSRTLRRTFKEAKSSGLWKDTYSATNNAEYWAEGVQAYFDCCRRSRTGKADGVHNQVGNREELIAYDPNLAKLVDDTLRSVEWRYTRYTLRHPKPAELNADAGQIPEGKVIAIPKSIIEKYKIDPNFYKKMISARGMPITCSAKVSDAALLQADELVNKLLAGRPDVMQAMVDKNYRLIIIGANEEVSEVPEYFTNDPVRSAYQNERVRGYGGRTTSFGEENVLCLPIDRYDDESIMIHEFGGHCVDSALRSVDPNIGRKLRQLYKDATSKGLYKNTYAGSNVAEYWAEAVQDYFDCNRRNNWNHTWVHTREELMSYDPNMCKFVGETFNLTPGQDWRYKWLAKQPAVTTPPAKLNCDPFYKKYVYCRSLPIIGSEKASDEAMLKANQVIRDMFTFRHDILKAMIDKGLRVVVLGEGESSANVPECKPLSYIDRCILMTGSQPRLVIGQDYILTPEKYGENVLVKEFAKAIPIMVGTRPFDPNFEKSRRDKQQYELYGVVRVDVNFSNQLDGLYKKAMEKGLWKGTEAAQNAADYFAEGVQSWFDCNGKVKDSSGREINNREQLQKCDPDLAAFIADTFKHTQHEKFDWRCPVADVKKK
jgi:alpha-glucosidase